MFTFAKQVLTECSKKHIFERLRRWSLRSTHRCTDMHDVCMLCYSAIYRYLWHWQSRHWRRISHSPLLWQRPNQTDAPRVAVVVMCMVVITTAEFSNTDNIQHSWEIAITLHGGRLIRLSVGGISTWHSAETFCHMGMLWVPFMNIISDLGCIRRSCLVGCGVTNWLDGVVGPLCGAVD